MELSAYTSPTASKIQYFPEEFFELKSQIHARLLDLIDLSKLDSIDQGTLKSQIRSLVEEIYRSEPNRVPMNFSERERFFNEIEDEVLGLGPLEPFMRDPSISDVLVNTYDQIYVEHHGKLVPTEGRFKDNDHLMKIIDKIVSSVGRHIDESTPMVDARLPDGSRVNAIIPPLAIDGPILSIRRFAATPLEIEDLILLHTLPSEIVRFLSGIVTSKINIMISGGTGSGKTTFLNVLSRFIPEDERIVTIEDAAELQLKQQHVVRLETRPANIEGRGEVTQRELVKNSLRMRPDRIILGEVRGPEALDMLQAMNTGHEGSLTTIHANSGRDALLRLETMVAMADLEIPSLFLRRYISSAIEIIIHIERLTDGSRKLVSIQEVTGMEGDVITMQEIFSFQKAAVDPDGKVKGHFKFSGIRPKCVDRLRAAGIEVPDNTFEAKSVLDV
jgi:pilus assembly protein CpaF